MQSTSCEMPGWMEHKLESRLQGETAIISDTQMTAPLREKVKRKEAKEQSRKAGLKFKIQKTKIMASGPITSRQIDGERNGNTDRLYFLFSWTQKSLQMVTAATKLRDICCLE